MQEIVLLLTGVAGAASAVAYRRLPGRGALRRGGRGRRAGGQDASGRIRSRIGALAAERDILGKAISRVHEDAALNGRQKDALLAMYQRQLASVLAKIDRLEEASRYPDLGPVGDGLAELMDQKLSSLDERLHELSARIAAAVPAAAEAEAESEGAAQGPRGRRPGKKADVREKAAVAGPDAAASSGASPEGGAAAAQQATLDMPRQEQQLQEQPATLQQAQQQQQQQQRQPEAKGPRVKPASPGMRQGVKPVEITTLTTIGGGERKFPEVGRPAGAGAARAQPPPSPSSQPPRPSPRPQAGAAQQPGQAKPDAGARARASTVATADAATAAAASAPAAGAGPQHAASSSLPERLPKPRPFSVPDAEEQDLAADDPADDDLAAIVADIRSTLSKLEQAEVE